MKEQEGQVIQYIDGFAWGITPRGDTICLGTETDIRTIVANPKLHPKNPTIAQVISTERALSKQEKTKAEKEQAKVETVRKERHQRAIEMGVTRKTKKPRKNKSRA